MKSNIYYSKKYSSMYMDIAYRVALESSATRAKVGCVILLKDLTLLHGFNGMPSGSLSEVCEDDNNVTLPECRHSERNTLAKAKESQVDTQGGVAFITLSPCKDCCELMFSRGIKRVYYRENYRDTSHLSNYILSGMDIINLRRKK